MNQTKTIQTLKAEWITSEAFQPYGQLITPTEDSKTYDEKDAQLNLENGTPRFYIMQLQKRGRKFHKITRHVQCTQCLGALEGKDWYLAVAPPSESQQPNLEHLKAFHIPGDAFIKLNLGTWHAGPYFDQDIVNFYNLELSDTNEVDHFTYDFLKRNNLEFELWATAPCCTR